MSIKKGSITLGDKSDTSDTSKYYFDVDTNGHLSWNEQYSSMTANGKFSARDATLSGTITTGSETSGTYTKMSGGSLTFKYNGEEMYTQKGQYFDDSSYHGVALQFADDGDFWAITEYRGSLIKPMLLVSHNPGSNSAARHEHGVYCTVPFFIGASGHRALTGGDPWNAHLYIGTDAEIRLSEDAEGKPSGTYKSGYTGTVGSSVFKKGICVGKTNTDISLDQKLTASNGLDVSSSFSIRNNTDANIYTNVYFHDWNIYDVDIFNGRYNTEWNGATYNGQTFTGNGSPKAVRFTAPDGTYWDAYVVNGIIT